MSVCRVLVAPVLIASVLALALAGSAASVHAHAADDTITPHPADVTGQEYWPTHVNEPFSDSTSGRTSTDFSAMMDYGDGTAAISAPVEHDPYGGPQDFIVQGWNYFHEEGWLTVTTTVTVIPTGQVVTFTSHAQISDTDGFNGTPRQITVSSGTTVSGILASFNLAGSYSVSAMSISDVDTTISWGDGTSGSGTIAPDPGPIAGIYDVTGSHTYAAQGGYNIDVTIRDDGAGTASLTLHSQAFVGEVIKATGHAFSVAVGVAYKGALATFVDSTTTRTPSDFTATINWGDGVITDGVPDTTDGACCLNYITVYGTHTYGAAGKYTVTTTLLPRISGPPTTKVSSTATVTGGPTLPGSAAPTPTSVHGTPGATVGAVPTLTALPTATPTAGQATAQLIGADNAGRWALVFGGLGTVAGVGALSMAGVFFRRRKKLPL